MKYLFATLFLLLPTSLWAQDLVPELLAKYRAVTESCLSEHEWADEQDACIWMLSQTCQELDEAGMSSYGITACFMAEADFWQERLDETLEKVRVSSRELDDYEREEMPVFAVREEYLAEAQLRWESYRDAECAFEQSVTGMGTMGANIGAACWMHLNAARYLELLGFLQSYG